MIYAKKKNANEDNFVALLETTKLSLVAELQRNDKVSPLSFEALVCEKMREVSSGTEFEGTIKQTSVHAFPDIIANGYFGVEVKITTKDHWTSTGNSVLESTRGNKVKRIYIMFGKLGGIVDVRYRLYQECLPEVSVTHSPRYKINMDLPSGKSIFDKIGVDYDTLRESDDTIQQIKNYYKEQLKEGEELWWIDEEKENGSSSPVIRPLRGFEKKEKENFIVEAMILFPEMFGSSTTKFERAAAYLITEYNAVSANLRDTFTAGGQKTIKIKNSNVTVPKIFFHLFSRSKAI
ncbi:MAG: hypothetical protein KAS07_04445, partial [Candidatus Pacebacteria bacterium]|nr:hypothetical protein [Candidatus Paceibacterota bacterium]